MKSLSIALLLTVFFAASAYAQPVQSVSAVPGPPSYVVANLLYDQTDFAAGNGAPDQNFEAAMDGYDCEGADDFVVPAPGWIVDEVFIAGVNSGISASVNVAFYTDNAGMPGTLVQGFTGIASTQVGGDHTVLLPTTVELVPGTYWLVFSVNQDFDPQGQSFWSNRSVQSGYGSLWRNPNGAFATVTGVSCTDWNTQIYCNVGGGASPDFLFQIGGQLRTYDVPTANNWGMAAAMMLAGAFAVYMLRKRTA